MKVLVTGGRDFKDQAVVDDALDAFLVLSDPVLVIHGGARGADRLAQNWVDRHPGKAGASVYPADWRTHGKAAGPIRNRQMLRYGQPDLVIAFPGGKGTADMIVAAHKVGVEVWQKKVDGP